MKLEDYQKLTGNTDIVKYEVIIDKGEEELKFEKKKCMVLADTHAMIALVVEDEPDVIVNVGVGKSPYNFCLSDQLGYPHIWKSELNETIHCDLYATLDEETAIDMMKNAILLEIAKDLTEYEVLRDLTCKL